MGPYGNQKFYTLRTGERLSLNEPWTDPSNRNDSQYSGKLQRRGWILNLGNKIQNLEWLPMKQELRNICLYLFYKRIPLADHITFPKS